MKRILLIVSALFLCNSVAHSQPITRLCITTNGSNCVPIDASNPLPVTGGGGGGGGTGTIGSAVPSTGVYNGINVAGTLRGLTGLATGSLFPATVAIVDASGNQITSFGGSGGTASNFGSTFPTVGTAVGLSDGTNMLAFRGDNTNGLWANIKTSVLPTGASTAANQSTIITALGSPFQAGGSIGNTTFAVTNVGTFAVQATLAAETTKVIGTVNQGTSPWVTSISGTVPLPTGAATAALQTTGNTALTTINTTLGTPFQAGGSIGNTSFIATQATAASFNATVVGTGTLAVQLTGATNNINNIAGTISLPTGASTAANQTNASQKTQIVDGSGNVIGATSNALNVNITGGGGSGGTSSNFGSAFPTAGTAAGFTNGTNMTAASVGAVSNVAAATNYLNTLTIGQYNATPVTITDTRYNAAQLDINGYLKVNVAAGGASGGTSSSFAAAFPATGTAAGVSDGTNMVALKIGPAGTAASTVLSVQGIAGMTKLLVTPDSVALPANQSVNVSQINAVTPLMGNGVTGTGSQRVTIASDNTAFSVNATLSAETTKVIGTVNQGTSPWIVAGGGTAGSAATGVVTIQGIASGTVVPVSLASTTITGTVAATQSGTWTVQPGNTANTTAWLVTGTGGTFPVTATNLSTNIAQMNGVTVTMGNGVSGTGVQRVTLASDSTGQVTLATGANTIGALTANQSVNNAQVSGTAVAVNNGTASAGVQRVAIASDNSAVAGLGVAATAGTVPTNAVYNGARTSGGLTGLIGCDSTATYSASTSGSTQLVALTSTQIIFVCGYSITVGSTATNVKLVYGTGTNCVTSPSDMTPAFNFAANGGIAENSPFYRGLKTIASNALCINTSAGNAVQAIVYYTKMVP